jgi:hypothetical protein
VRGGAVAPPYRHQPPAGQSTVVAVMPVLTFSPVSLTAFTHQVTVKGQHDAMVSAFSYAQSRGVHIEFVVVK